MEAQVYQYGPNDALKFYRQPCDMEYMQRLERFYRAIDRHRLPFALPEILEISADLGYVVVRERMCAWHQSSDDIAHLDTRTVDNGHATLLRYDYGSGTDYTDRETVVWPTDE